MTKEKTEQLRTLDHKEMGKRIRKRREAKGLSRENLAEKLSVSPQFIADIEYGNKGISIKRLYWLCQILDVTSDYILAGNVYSQDKDEDAVKVCEEIMGLLQRCDARQLAGIRGIAEIYADSMSIK